MPSVIFCIKNYFDEIEFINVKFKYAKILEKDYCEENQLAKINEQNALLNVDGISLHFFLKEIFFWNNFRRILLNIEPLRSNVFIIKVIPPEKEPLDYKWNEMVSKTLWEKVEIDNLISWLSTLGGGFSALGENFSSHAKIAGKLSLKQLELGLKLGDPFLQARCKLYYSISLIQIGKLRQAKFLIRQQYEFANRNKEIDSKLVNMCKGIWLKLQYAYLQRKKVDKTIKYEINDNCDNKFGRT